MIINLFIVTPTKLGPMWKFRVTQKVNHRTGKVRIYPHYALKHTANNGDRLVWELKQCKEGWALEGRTHISRIFQWISPPDWRKRGSWDEIVLCMNKHVPEALR